MFSKIRQLVFGKTDEELAAEGKCPDCKKGPLLQGPSGGASMNILCDNCLHEFNFMFLFDVIRIDDRRGLVSKERARVFGISEDEYDSKITSHAAA